jgi:hypothetical protein
MTKTFVDVNRGQIVICATKPLTPAEAFTFAEQICAAAYSAQGGPAKDPDERFEQQEAREQRGASAFEELHCLLRDIANDWHREAIRRRDGKEPGQFEADFCDADKAIELTTRTAFERIKDWNY